MRFDPARFTYIGSPGPVNSVLYVRSSTGIASFADLKASRRPLVFGALGNLTPTAMIPFMLAAQGLPIKVIVGYVSSARVVIALEQGEVDGFFTVEAAFGLRRELIERKIIIPILQNRPVHPGIPLLKDVLPASDGPLLEVVMAVETFGLPLIGPPGVPAERVETLRRAFAAMCAGADYQAEAARLDVPVGEPIEGAELALMMDRLIAAATPELVTRYKRLATAA